MRFLCLHGSGTSSQVFETQFATIRYEMEGNHDFEFVEGTVITDIAPEIKGYYPSGDTYYEYYDHESAASMMTALNQLHDYLEAEGPFDGVIGFSQGAGLAAEYLIWQTQSNPTAALPFKCAIFFSGGRPLDPALLEQNVRKLIEPKETGPLIALPTAHIWGRNDMRWPGSSEALSEVCLKTMKEVYLHDEGHEIPGARAKDAVQGSIRTIRRALDRALLIH